MWTRRLSLLALIGLVTVAVALPLPERSMALLAHMNGRISMQAVTSLAVPAESPVSTGIDDSQERSPAPANNEEPDKVEGEGAPDSPDSDGALEDPDDSLKDSQESTDLPESINSTESAETAESPDSGESLATAESSESAESADSNESLATAESSQSAESPDSGESLATAESSESAESPDSNDVESPDSNNVESPDSNNVESPDSTESPESVESVDSIDPLSDVESVESAESTDFIDPLADVEPADSSELLSNFIAPESIEAPVIDVPLETAITQEFIDPADSAASSELPAYVEELPQSPEPADESSSEVIDGDQKPSSDPDSVFDSVPGGQLGPEVVDEEDIREGDQIPGSDVFDGPDLMEGAEIREVDEKSVEDGKGSDAEVGGDAFTGDVNGEEPRVPDPEESSQILDSTEAPVAQQSDSVTSNPR
ncbi:uncharacterized protein LOC144215067 isoform X2 [Stigmatopora nigra]